MCSNWKLNVSSRIFLQVILPALILKRNFLWWGPGVDPENSERGGRDTCQLYKFFLFFWEFYKNNKKRKRGGLGPLGPHLNPPLRPQLMKPHKVFSLRLYHLLWKVNYSAFVFSICHDHSFFQNTVNPICITMFLCICFSLKAYEKNYVFHSNF